FACPICWELLSRPVTLMCGHTACEACVALHFKSRTEGAGGRNAPITCPAGCQRDLVPALPEVNTLLSTQLIQCFPEESRARAAAVKGNQTVVDEVRGLN
ncbi:unnamed protein product, partial [Chrysoparadoxa australica]